MKICLFPRHTNFQTESASKLRLFLEGHRRNEMTIDSSNLEGVGGGEATLLPTNPPPRVSDSDLLEVE